MVKAADIPDARLLALLPPSPGPSIGISRWTLAELLPEYPEKVIVAKLVKLKRRGLADGCDCGCRGDWVRLEPPRA